MSERLDCDCPKRDPYLCAAWDMAHFGVRRNYTMEDADGEEFCICGCHSDWIDEAKALVGGERTGNGALDLSA